MINTKQENKAHAGFTLIEMLLVLMITTVVIGLPALLSLSAQQSILVGQFLTGFEKQLLHTQQLAVTGTEDTSVYLSFAEHHLSFQTSVDKRILAIPKELTAEGPEKIVFKRGTGNNGRLGKYCFTWTAKGKKIEYQLQMGSGRFTKKLIQL